MKGLLSVPSCLCLKDRTWVLGWELVDEWRGASEAKQLCG